MEHQHLNEFLYRNRLLARGDKAVWTPLAGGVSSDIWRVDLPERTICVKRALKRLRVAAEWEAPVERNRLEWEWFSFVHRHFPANVPRPIVHDEVMQMLAMEYLAPEKFVVWKTELLDETADADFAAAVGASLGKIHAAGAGDPDLKRTFAADDYFFALRMEPYLLATAQRHPDLAASLQQLAVATLRAKITIVHGDVSPKNILKGGAQPVYLDAETACCGDPAFDLAFCLNHLLLKSVHRPAAAPGYLKCFRLLKDNYLREVAWESPAAAEVRAARLLPALLLARVDGKSPVEYLTDETSKNLVRAKARRLIRREPARLEAIADEFKAS